MAYFYPLFFTIFQDAARKRLQDLEDERKAKKDRDDAERL